MRRLLLRIVPVLVVLAGLVVTLSIAGVLGGGGGRGPAVGDALGRRRARPPPAPVITQPVASKPAPAAPVPPAGRRPPAAPKAPAKPKAASPKATRPPAPAPARGPARRAGRGPGGRPDAGRHADPDPDPAPADPAPARRPRRPRRPGRHGFADQALGPVGSAGAPVTRRIAVAAAAAAGLLVLAPGPGLATSLPQRTFQVTTDVKGPGTDGAVSMDGSAIALISGANVYVSSVLTGASSLVSVGLGGAAANGPSWTPAISGDGTAVAFASTATNLTTAGGTGTSQIYARGAAGIEPVSVAADGGLANGPSSQPAISVDGRYVAFASTATDLVPATATGRATSSCATA